MSALSIFDVVQDSSNINSYRRDATRDVFGVAAEADGALAMWVADMEFATPAFCIDAMRQRLAKPVLGYTLHGAARDAAIQYWMRARFRWSIDAAWIGAFPTVVAALANCVRAYSARGDAVTILTPVYYPFADVVFANGRRLIKCPLVATPSPTSRVYDIDFDALRAAISQSRILLFWFGSFVLVLVVLCFA